MLIIPSINALAAARYAAIFFGTFTTFVFFIILLENIEEMRRIRRYAVTDATLPEVTAIIPAYNESDCIGSTIESILDLDYPKNKLNVLVVDDGSTDDTLAKAKTYEGPHVKALTKKNSGKAASTNYGIKHATSDYLLIIDADSYLDKGALLSMLPYFEDPKVMAVITTIKVYKPATLLESIQMVEYAVGNFLRKILTFINSLSLVPACVLMKRQFLTTHGGFDETVLTEDYEMGLRIRSHGYKIAQAHDVSAHTRVPDTLKGLSRQRLRWYYGGYDNIITYRKFLLNKKYEDFGLFNFPATIISIFLTILLFLYTLYTIGLILYNNILLVHYAGIGVILRGISLSVDFHPGLNPMPYLLAFCFIASLLTFALSKRYLGIKKLNFAFFAYLLGYWFIFSFFSVKALVLYLTGKSPGWKKVRK
ncbi:Glycosyltransferase AglI [uncultured archaeon]|nr:Glycosyltransferase AglI [uncultured archaeon]